MVGDGKGISIQEFNHKELEKLIKEAGFNIINKYGTFASIRDYKPLMNEWQLNMYNGLKDYFDANLLSNIMAPFFPEQSRNTLWVFEKKKSIGDKIKNIFR